MGKIRFAVIAGGALLLASQASAQAPGGEAPPPGVTVQTIVPRNLPVTYEYAGRVAASREVQVRARVGGILLERAFEEGSRVKAGDLLFRIDPASYEAEVALANAQVLEAQAALSQARRAEERARALAQRGAASQAILDDATSARELAEAQVAAAQARQRTANLSLDYATVEAPVDGITSLEQVPEGSLLSSGDFLTRIDQLDPINVNFSAADTEAASIRELIASGAMDGPSELSELTVSVRFGDGSTYGETGMIDFTSSTIDSNTGTILSRAVLPNPNQRLLPGQFVRLALEGLSVENAITIPTEALMQGPQGTFVYVLGGENVAEVRPITVGRDLDDSILVSNGLEAGDKVIVNGVVKVRPGSPVDPQEAETGAPAQGEAEPQQSAPADEGANSEPETAGEPAEPRAAENQEDAALERDTVATPPVPRSALPDGQAARDAQHGRSRRAELSE